MALDFSATLLSFLTSLLLPFYSAYFLSDLDLSAFFDGSAAFTGLTASFLAGFSSALLFLLFSTLGSSYFLVSFFLGSGAADFLTGSLFFSEFLVSRTGSLTVSLTAAGFFASTTGSFLAGTAAFLDLESLAPPTTLTSAL